MLEPRSVDGFQKAREWLSAFTKTSRFNRRATSYGLKHVAEHTIGYVTNGMFIAAALAEGFRIDPRGPSAYFNISRVASPRRFAAPRRTCAPDASQCGSSPPAD